MKLFKATGLALALALSPLALKAIEVHNTDDVKVDVGARLQLLGTLDYTGNASFVPGTTGNSNRDFTRILLFQKQNRLTLDGVLDGTIVKFEAPFGADAYSGGNNLHNLHEFSAEINLGENYSIVAGLSKMPWNHASAVYDETSLFTSKSELHNLFFNSGYDTTVFAKARWGLFDAILGVEQGAGNLPQRYIPEGLILPVPTFLRIGAGNLREDPARFRQMDFGKLEETQWAIHAAGFVAADSQAGHGTLFSQMGSQAELSKGPFESGNFMFVKGVNPLAGYTTGPGGLARPDNQFWQAIVDTQLRVPVGEDGAFVFGGQWNVAQYVAKGMYTANKPTIYRDGKAYVMNFGQITVQGGEAYLGYVTPKWAAATRVNVLLPDPLLGTRGTGTTVATTGVSFFKSDPIWEITFPSLTYKLSKFTKLVAETEFTYNAPEVVDTNGVYQFKTVPIEYTLVTAANPMSRSWVTGRGRLMLQVAF